MVGRTVSQNRRHRSFRYTACHDECVTTLSVSFSLLVGCRRRLLRFSFRQGRRSHGTGGKPLHSRTALCMGLKFRFRMQSKRGVGGREGRKMVAVITELQL